MSKLEELIKEFCPNGVEMIELFKIAKIVRGDRITKKDIVEDGAFPVISGGQMPMGRYSKFNREASTISISSYGAAGYIGFQMGKFWANDVCLCVFPSEKVENKYLYYALKTKQNYLYSKTTKAIPDHIPTTVLQELQIPLPALPVQREIVRILDSFTLYSAELTAELTARRKQYEFYRDKLLMPKSSTYQTEWKELKDVCRLVTGATPSTSKKEYWENGTIPWMSSGEVNNKRIFYTEEKITELGYQSSSTTLVPIHSVVIALAGQGKTRGKVAITEIELCTNQSLCSLICGTSMNYKFLYYYLDGKYEELRAISNGDGTRGGLSLRLLAPYKIPVPPIDVQERIVKVLDNFDAICSDLGIGLPAEIEKRQKQYEYYREKLLTFDGKYATILTERNGTERNGTERNGTERAGLIRLLQYVYGFAFVRLEDIADYSTNRITAKSVDKNNYVGVDNLLADRQGKTESVYVPENGNLIEFRNENTLIGNIRPYLKKIWFANCDGGTNGDVLVIKANEDYVMPKYLYYVLSSDKFFAFDMQYAKGAKMPRGNKVAIMTYQFSLPTIDKQKEIVNILDKFDSLCNDLSAGLPAEIEHRQKQYEYYRDKLLTF